MIAALTVLTDTEKVALVALAGVLVSAALSALVALAVSRRSTYITTVTTERSKWIDALRKNISSLIGHHRQFIINSPEAKYSESEIYKQHAKEVGELTALIKLQLNPTANIDHNMIVLLNKIQSEFRDINFDYHKAERLLVQHSQWLLKEEWERVKYESSGIISRYINAAQRDRRRRLYNIFFEGDGAIGELRVNKSNTKALRTE